MRIGNLIFPLLLLTTMNLAAMEHGGEATASAAQSSPSSEGAMVSFGALKDGDMVPPTFSVTFVISGMGVAPAGTNIENTGHHHLLIDVVELPDMNSLCLNQTRSGISVTARPRSNSRFRKESTPSVVFADYLHRPHDPVVISEKITVTVSQTQCQQGSQNDYRR